MDTWTIQVMGRVNRDMCGVRFLKMEGSKKYRTKGYLKASILTLLCHFDNDEDAIAALDQDIDLCREDIHMLYNPNLRGL